MRIVDKLYGSFEIKELILLDLIKSKPILRLKKISQFGLPYRYYFLKGFSRYEHSIGVMLLLRKLQAPLEEQVAGLIHDVSHLAFSHLADWIFAKGQYGKEGLQDSLMEEFVKTSEIAEILIKYNFSVNKFIKSKNFSLLEQDIPDLCADRVDYALREFFYWLKPSIVGTCLKALVNLSGEIVFSNQNTAFLFASNFLELQTKHWGEQDKVIRYYFFSKAVKRAIDVNLITKRDFYGEEEDILEKLEKSKDSAIREILKELSHKKVKVNWKANKKVYKKFRYVDPKFLVNGSLKRLSYVSVDFKKLLNIHQQINKSGILVYELPLSKVTS